jgi:hypothetical protein
MLIDGDDVDPIAPVTIEHCVDELWLDEARTSLDQVYNYLVYHFEKDGRYCWARAYLDRPNSAELHGAFAGRGSLSYVPDPDFEAVCTAYLRRRFTEVKREDPAVYGFADVKPTNE